MRIKRIWIMFKARNWEFFRDRASFGWNFLFPFLLVAGFGILFGGKEPTAYKIGVFPEPTNGVEVASLELPDAFKKTRFLQFVGFASQTEAMEKLRHHKVDIVIRTGPPPYPYWINDSSPNGHLVEKIFQASLAGPNRFITDPARPDSQCRNPLYRLAVSRHFSHEHDVQCAVGGRLHRCPLP